MAGIIYRFNLFHVQRWLKLPEFMTVAVSTTFGNLFASQGPTSQPYAMGATIEIQRQQQMEHYEQQALRVARMGSLRNRVLLKKLHILQIIFLQSTPALWTPTSGLKIATDTVANATNILSLATKNSSLVAKVATRFLYDLDLN